MKRNVAILVFEEVEVLDFAGPYEVFGVSSNLHDNQLFNVFNIAKTSNPVFARNQFSVNPAYSFEHHPKIDILVIPGGIGTKALIKDTATLEWVANVHHTTQITMSVCTGSFVLGKLGLLDHKPYSTHQDGWALMQVLVPTGIPQKDFRYTESEPGRIYTSAGIAAGIDLSMHIVGMLHGQEAVRKTSIEMEYSPHPQDYNNWGA